MTLELTPLGSDELSEPLRRVLGPQAPAPLKLMAARGLAPMGPRDLVTAIYQLALDADATVAQAAHKTAAELPERMLAGALAEPLDARVLDFFARRLYQRRGLVELILLNRAAHDATFVYLGTVCDERELEIIAQAEERCLRAPAIVEALYFNPRARMSTVDRLIELCARHEVALDRIPHFKEIAAALRGAEPASPAAAAEDDEAFRAAFAAGLEAFAEPDTDAADEVVGELVEGASEAADTARLNVDAIKNQKLSVKIRLATVGTAFHRAILIRDSNRQVALAAVRSPGISENEVVRYAANRALCEDVIRYIANHRELLKSYAVKVNLTNNPKCPLPTSMRLLQYLRAHDLKAIARSKSVPTALVTAAKKILSTKRT